jgi:two-component system CheB/CheR fusion protein
LEIDVEKVLQTLHPLQKEIKTNQGYALIKIIPYKTDDRRIDGIIITFVDVTELKKTNLKLKQMAEVLQKRTDELEQSEKYWRSLVENTPDFVARFDRDATILYANQSLISHTGTEANQLIGKKLFDLKGLCNEEGYRQLYQQFAKVISNEQVLNFYQNFISNGEVKCFFITIIPELRLKEEYGNIILIARDITEMRVVEANLEEKNRRLEDMNQYMDNFVHAVAHDLRSPLTNLKLISELISDEANTEKKEILVGKLNIEQGRRED